MDGRQFMKVFKKGNGNLISNKLTPTDIDMAFTYVKEKGKRRITYE